MSDDVANRASMAPRGYFDERRPSKERASAGAPASHAGACRLSQAVAPASHAGTFRRQATKTLLSNMLSSDAPQHATTLLPTASDNTTASTVSSDDEEDFDVAASMRILHEHRLRVKAMTPAAKPDLFGSFNTRARSFEGGSFEDHGASFMDEQARRYQSISTRVPRSPEAGAGPRSPGAGTGGRSMSSLLSRSSPETGPGKGSLGGIRSPEAGPGKGSFGGILRRSILKQHFSPERIQRTLNSNAISDSPLSISEDSASARETLRLHAREAIARSFQAQNLLDPCPPRKPSPPLIRCNAQRLSTNQPTLVELSLPRTATIPAQTAARSADRGARGRRAASTHFFSHGVQAGSHPPEHRAPSTTPPR